MQVEVVALVLCEDDAAHIGGEGGIVLVAEVVRDLRIASPIRVDGADLIDFLAGTRENDPPAEGGERGCGGWGWRMGWDGRGGGQIFGLDREDRVDFVNGDQPEEQDDRPEEDQADGDDNTPSRFFAKQFFAAFARGVFAVKAGEGHINLILLFLDIYPLLVETIRDLSICTNNPHSLSGE